MFSLAYTMVSSSNLWERDIQQYYHQLRILNNSKLVIPENENLFGSSPISEYQFEQGVFLMGCQPGYHVMNNEWDILGDNLYLVHLNPTELDDLLEKSWVEWLEVDSQFKTLDCDPWGLDRLDKRMDCRFNSKGWSGKGSHVYVVDTGIASGHQEFLGRLGEGVNYVTIDNFVTNRTSGFDWEDCDGHGTHVAGTVGGVKYGVAKEVELHGVRVLSCSGSGLTSWIVKGMEWCLKHAQANGIKHGIVSMSLGGGESPSMKRAVRHLVDNGMIVVVAAGNEDTDACTGSPANAELAITVGATTKLDRRAGYSNYGDCLDIFAPGSNIKSAWIGGDRETSTISGTSMATPHVSGVIALLLQYMNLKGTLITPSTILQLLKDLSEVDKIQDSKSINNYFLNIPNMEKPISGPTPPPTPNRDSDEISPINITLIILLILIVFMCFCMTYNRNDRNSGVIRRNNIEDTLSRM